MLSGIIESISAASIRIPQCNGLDRYLVTNARPFANAKQRGKEVRARCRRSPQSCASANLSPDPEGSDPLWHRRILKPVHMCNVWRSNGGTRRNQHSTNHEESDDEQERDARNKKPEDSRDRRSATTSLPSGLEIAHDGRTSFARRRMRVYESGPKIAKKDQPTEGSE